MEKIYTPLRVYKTIVTFETPHVIQSHTQSETINNIDCMAKFIIYNNVLSIVVVIAFMQSINYPKNVAEETILVMFRSLFKIYICPKFKFNLKVKVGELGMLKSGASQKVLKYRIAKLYSAFALFR